MILEKSVASKLRCLKPGDTIEINGEKFQIISAWESCDPGKLIKPRETRSEGMEFELRGEDSSSYSLFLTDIEVEYERVNVLDGPAPLNSNPNIVFIQDLDIDKTYKYTIKRRPKKDVSLKFLKGSDLVELKSIITP